jgi:hypothetical protein
MIPRRIYEHVKAHDWFAVAMDFVIVVLGVFIGIQVSNWNAAREERASEAIYLAGVVDDLRADIGEIDGIVSVAASRMAALELLFSNIGDWRRPADFPSSRGAAVIESVAPFDEASGNTIAGELFILNTLDGNRFTYETLINTGGIGVIRDKSLVRNIQEYYAAVDQADHFEESLEDNRLRLIDALQQAGFSAVDGASAEALAIRIGDNAPLVAAAKNYWLYANRQIILMNALKEKAGRLADRIERENRR